MACKKNNQCDFCDARCPNWYDDECNKWESQEPKEVKKYVLIETSTGYIMDIISTILEDQPMIYDPYFAHFIDIKNIEVKDKRKAERALEICKRWYGYDRGWKIKELVYEE
jgi:hypothetical protein